MIQTGLARLGQAGLLPFARRWLREYLLCPLLLSDLKM